MSPFATCLVDMFKLVFDEDGWARFLGMPKESLRKWTNDEAFPRPDLLWMVIDVIDGTKGPKEAVIAFKAMAERPSKETTPFGERLGKDSVKEFMIQTSISAMGRHIREASAEEQVRVLEDGHWL